MAGINNGNFETFPATNVALATGAVGVWLDGTVNGSSSNQAYWWRIESNLGVSTAIFDTSVSRTGSCSMKISTLASSSLIGFVSNSGNLSDGTMIPALPYTSYTLKGWIKTQNNLGAANTGAYLSVREMDKNTGSVIASHNTTGVTGTTNWTQYSTTFTTGAACGGLSVGGFITGNDGLATLLMDAWFDDLELSGGPVDFTGFGARMVI